MSYKNPGLIDKSAVWKARSSIGEKMNAAWQVAYENGRKNYLDNLAKNELAEEKRLAGMQSYIDKVVGMPTLTGGENFQEGMENLLMANGDILQGIDKRVTDGEITQEQGMWERARYNKLPTQMSELIGALGPDIQKYIDALKIDSGAGSVDISNMPADMRVLYDSFVNNKGGNIKQEMVNGQWALTIPQKDGKDLNINAGELYTHLIGGGTNVPLNGDIAQILAPTMKSIKGDWYNIDISKTTQSGGDTTTSKGIEYNNKKLLENINAWNFNDIITGPNAGSMWFQLQQWGKQNPNLVGHIADDDYAPWPETQTLPNGTIPDTVKKQRDEMRTLLKGYILDKNNATKFGIKGDINVSDNYYDEQSISTKDNKNYTNPNIKEWKSNKQAEDVYSNLYDELSKVEELVENRPTQPSYSAAEYRTLLLVDILNNKATGNRNFMTGETWNREHKNDEGFEAVPDSIMLVETADGLMEVKQEKFQDLLDFAAAESGLTKAYINKFKLSKKYKKKWTI